MPRSKSFKEIRLSAGFTQEGLARELDVAVKTVCRWESGEGNPSLTQFFKLRELLGDVITGVFQNKTA